MSTYNTQHDDDNHGHHVTGTTWTERTLNFWNDDGTLRWFCYSACNYVVHMKRSNCKTSPWCPWLSSSCCVLYVLTTQLFLFSSSLLTHFVSFITLSLFYWIAGNTSEPNKIELFGIHKEETKTITSNRKRQQIYILYLFYQHTRYVCGREWKTRNERNNNNNNNNNSKKEENSILFLKCVPCFSCRFTNSVPDVPFSTSDEVVVAQVV